MNVLTVTEHHFREERAQQESTTTGHSFFALKVHLHLVQEKQKGGWASLEVDPLEKVSL